MKFRALGNTGLEVSVLGLGCSSLGSMFRNIDEAEGIRTVHEAVDAGINLIDVAPYYGITKAETVLGKAIKDLDRSKFILSTKVGRYGDDDFDFSPERIIQSVDESLQRLKTDHIDILFLHDIEYGSVERIIEESIPVLDELKSQGKIRFSGVSGFPLKIFKKVTEQSHVDTIISYCHYALNNTSLLDLVPSLQEKDVAIINAAPLSMGLLTKQFAPEWHPATEEIKNVCQKAIKFCNEQGEDIAKIAVQFSTSNEMIPTTLISTANPNNLKKNISWVNEQRNEELLMELQRILKPIQNKTWITGRPENN